MHGPLWLDFPGMYEYIRSTKKKVGAEQSGVASVHTVHAHTFFNVA
jgi:hypothetical protein